MILHKIVRFLLLFVIQFSFYCVSYCLFCLLIFILQMVEAGTQSNFKLTTTSATKVSPSNKTVIIETGTGEATTIVNNANATIGIVESQNDFNAIAANCNTNVCFFCQKSFTNVYNCRRHIRTHSGEKPFQCNVCGKRFSRQSTLNTHERIHTGDQLFKCDTCGRTFDIYRQLTEHMMIHRTDKPFSCKICNKSYSRATVLSQHMKLHSDQVNSFKCSTCSKVFFSEASLSSHESTHIQMANESSASATNSNSMSLSAPIAVIAVEEETPKILTTMTTLATLPTITMTTLKPVDETQFKGQIHMQNSAVETLVNDSVDRRVEIDQYDTIEDDLDDDDDTEDDFVMMTQVKLAQPPKVLLASDEVKIIACDLCGKQCKDENELRLHGKVHSCEKYKCDVCDKRFSILSNFNVHKRIHKRDKPFRCDVCGKSFRLAKSLTVHMALHNESDSFNCEICDRSFGRSGSLKVHMRSHTTVDTQRTYLDMICNDDDDDIDEDDQQLMYEYVDEKPTYCDICGEKFVRSNRNMRTHKCSKFSTNDDMEMDDPEDHSSNIDYWNCD